MNIIYIDHYAGSLRMGMEFRPFYLAREWQKQGHHVTIIGGDYSHLRSVQPEVTEDFQHQILDGVDYLWVRTGKYEGNGTKRALSMFRFVTKLWIRSNRIAHKMKPDVVITSSTYPLDCYAGYRLAKKSKAKYIHEAHDVWPLTLIELGGMSRWHPFVILLDIAERYAYQKAEKVVSLLPGTLPHMIEKGLKDERKFAHIPNGIALEDWNHAEPLLENHQMVLDQLHAEGKFVVGYVGGHALSNALDKMIDTAERMMDNQQIAFVLVGKGVEKPNLMKMAEEKGLTNIYFLPPVSKKQVPMLLKSMDALFICAEKCSLYRYGVSMNKVYDYMMAGKPILYGVEASNNDVKDADCGVCFDSGDPQSIVQALETMLSYTPKEREQLGRNATAWVIQNCDYQKLADRFLGILQS